MRSHAGSRGDQPPPPPLPPVPPPVDMCVPAAVTSCVTTSLMGGRSRPPRFVSTVPVRSDGAVGLSRLGRRWPSGRGQAPHASGSRGILKGCVNSQAVYPLFEQDGLGAQERRYTAHEQGNHRERVGVKARVGAVGGLGARLGSEIDPRVAGGRGDRVPGKGEVGPPV